MGRKPFLHYHLYPRSKCIPCIFLHFYKQLKHCRINGYKDYILLTTGVVFDVFLTEFLTKSVVGFAVIANLLTSYPEMVSNLPMASETANDKISRLIRNETLGMEKSS